MPLRLWQFCATAVVLLTLGLVAGDLLSLAPGGSYGMRLDRQNGHIEAAAVEPGSAAARAGIAAGDELDLDPADLTSRVRLNWPVAGDRIGIDVIHSGRRRSVELRAASSSGNSGLSNAVFRIYETLRVVMLAVALLIILRRPDLRAGRTLANFFVAFAYGFLGRTPWYPPVVTAIIDVSRPIAVLFALEQAALFSTIFPRPSLGGLRRLIERACPYLFGAGAAIGLVPTSLYYIAGIDVPGAPRAVFSAFIIAFIAMIAIGFSLGAREATPAERYRLHWISISLAIGFTGLFVGVSLEAAGVPEERWILLPLTLIAVPIGTTYAILRHRVLDVGFVVNRALVFALISGIVVLAFGLLEWFLGKYLLDIGHVGSSFIEATLALALALSLRQIHGRVDHFVDSVFFRQRHLAERALRRLAHEVAFIDDEGVLADRTVAAVDHYGRASGCAIYLAAGDRAFSLRVATLAGEPASVDANDSAVVAMRAFHEPVDLDDQGAARSALSGAVCFPMIVRGELIGLLDCGQKQSLEAYDPDERETLHVLARAIGHTFDAIRTSALRTAVDRALAGDGTLEDLRAARMALGAG